MELKLANIADATREKREDNARAIRDIADRVESGDVTEFALAGNDRADGNFFVIGSFDDRWRLLGAIEYAKRSVHEN